jgi:hypothetical protein
MFLTKEEVAKEKSNIPLHIQYPEVNSIVYYLLLMYHPKSDIYNLPEREKINIIMTYDKDFDIENILYNKYRLIVLDAILTPSERALLTLERKLRELTLFIEDTPYTLENVKLLNDSQIAMDKLTDTIKNIREKLAIESEVNNSSLLEDMYDSN